MHFNTVSIPEFARDYIENLGREYNFDDLTIMAKRQISSERCLQKMASNYLFCDTELTVIKIWAEHCYHVCPDWVTENLHKVRYDLYLLCNIDLPWEADPQREHPHLRKHFFELYYMELKNRNLPFVVISGTGDVRFDMAVKEVEKLIAKR